jgi:hypothetical protein
MHRKPITFVVAIVALSACGVGPAYRCVDGTVTDTLETCTRPLNMDTTTPSVVTCTTGTGFTYTAPIDPIEDSSTYEGQVPWAASTEPSCDVDARGTWTVGNVQPGATAHFSVKITATVDPHVWLLAIIYKNDRAWEHRHGCEGCGVSAVDATLPIATGDRFAIEAHYYFCAPPYGTGECYPWNLCRPRQPGDPMDLCRPWGQDGPMQHVPEPVFSDDPAASYWVVTL